jgi:hypothetical protein
MDPISMTAKVLLSFIKFVLWQNISSGASTASTAAWTLLKVCTTQK